MVSAGLLTIANGRFANTAEANYYLVRGNPTYMGSRHELWSLIWETELKTAESIRSRIGQSREYFDYAYTPPEKLEQVFRALHAGTVAQHFDFLACRTLLDVGGGSGGLAMALVETLPHLSATVVDLPS